MEVLICDDHALVAEGFVFLLESLAPGVRVAVATGEEQAVRLVREHSFELILLDWNLERGRTGAEALASLREAAPAARIVILSGEKDLRLVRQMIELGGAGFIPKSSSKDALQQALRTVLAGRIYLPPDFRWGAFAVGADAAPKAPELQEAFPSLTPRQLAVLRIVLRGSTDKLIARELDISTHTVRTHLKIIYAELGVQSRGEAVYLASRRGVRIG